MTKCSKGETSGSQSLPGTIKGETSCLQSLPGTGNRKDEPLCVENKGNIG